MRRIGINKIIIIYIMFVLIYGVIASLFTSTVHIDVDEELYLEMARSFHYEGRFALGGELINYSCILYSMLISLAYFFYAPEHILLIMRLIGVLTMTSAIFPIWLLSKKILVNAKAAFKITIFCMLLPFMFDSAYIMQEVLSYPLFLWVLWFLLCAVEKEAYKDYFLCALFSVLCFFSKTYLFFIPVIFNLVEGMDILLHRHDNGIAHKVKKLIVYDITYAIFFAAIYFGSYMINDFVKGTNHYSSQFSHLFPISMATIVCGICCCIFYMAFFIVNTGMIPFAALIQKQENVSGYKKKFWNYVFFSILFLVFEIVFMIVLTEEGNVLIPHKYLFRYFQIFCIPLLLAFLSSEKVFENNRKQWLLTGASCGITIFYWCMMYQKTSPGIMDGHLFVLLKNISRVIPYGGAIAVGTLFLLILVCIRRMKWRKPLAVSIVICFWLLNCIQLPYYTNVIASGAAIEDDAVKMAEYLNANEIADIYYVKSEGANPYLQNCYGYFKQSFKEIVPEQLEEYRNQEEAAFIMAATAEADDIFEGLQWIKRIELETEVLNIYVTERQ